MNMHLHRTPRCTHTLGLSTIIVPYMTLSKYHPSFKISIRKCLIIIVVICACMVYMCSYVCVHMCMWVYAHLCVNVCGGQRSTLAFLSPPQGSLTEPGAHPFG